MLAGGQSLVPLLKLRFASPELLVDINNIPGLDYHRVDADGTIHVGALCRHADLERSTILSPTAADDGRRRAADRRPDRAQPRHARRLALPRRPAGRLGVGRHRARRPRRRAGADGAGAPSRSPSSSPGPFQNVLAYDEIAVEAVIPAPKGEPAGGYLKLERRVGDFATAGVAVALETLRRARSPGPASRSTGVGGSTIDAADAAQALVGGPLAADTHRAGGRPGRAGGPAADRPPRQRGVQAAHRAHLRRAHPRPRRRVGGEGGLR